MRYAIVGSRRRLDRKNVEAFVAGLPEGSVVISGGCRGVDTWAAEAARARGLECVEHLPALPAADSPGYLFTKAYFARNRLIAADCDVLVAFVAPDRTGGTENTILHARKLGREIVLK